MSSAAASRGRMLNLMAQARSFEDEHAAEQFMTEYSRIASAGSATMAHHYRSPINVGSKRGRVESDAPLPASSSTGIQATGDILARYGLIDVDAAASSRAALEDAIKILSEKKNALLRSLAESTKQFKKLDTDAGHTRGVEMATEMKMVNGTLVAAPKNHEITQVFKQMQEKREAVVKKIEGLRVSIVQVNADIQQTHTRVAEGEDILVGLVELCEQAPFEDGSGAATEGENNNGSALLPIEVNTNITNSDIVSARSSKDSAHKSNPFGKSVLVMGPSQSVLSGKGPSLADRATKGASEDKKKAAESSSSSKQQQQSSDDTVDADVLSRYRARLETIGKLRRQPGFLAMTPLDRVRAEMDALQAKRNKFHRVRK